MAPDTFAWLAFALYLATAGILGRRLQRGNGSVSTGAALLWFAALVAHAAGLSESVFAGDSLNLAFFKAGSATALLITALLLINCLRKPLTAIALFVLPIAAALVLAGQFNEREAIVVAPPGIRAHILSSLFAYSVLVLTGVQAIMLHFRDRELRGRGGESLLRTLPPLDAMESFLFHLLTLGFILLTISLVSGWIYHHSLFAQHLVHKTALGAAAWLLFAILLVGHLFAGWRGGVAVKLTLSGLVLLATAYFGSKFVLEYILHRA